MLFGPMARNSGLNWCLARRSTPAVRYSRPVSSRKIVTLWAFGVGHMCSSSTESLRDIRMAGQL